MTPTAFDYIQDNEIIIWWTHIDNPPIKPATLETFLSQQEKEKLNRLINPAVKSRFIVSKGLLRYILSNYLTQDPKSFEFSTGEHGKPFLSSGQQKYTKKNIGDRHLPVPNKNLHFNVSHSGNIAIFGFSHEPLGIDIEEMRKKVDFEGIMHRYFSAKEISSWKQHSAPSKLESFFLGWTRKEAILKATGIGIAGLNKVEISFDPALTKTTDNWNFWLNEAIKGYKISAAWEGSHKKIIFQQLFI
jgi:4'-phosphopantetheinyl transferase